MQLGRLKPGRKFEVAMAGETALRLVLALVMVGQTTASAYFIRRAGASASMLRSRQAGPALTAALVISYLAYGVGVVAFLIAPGSMVWSTVDLSLIHI